jgi:hypothetical protein
MVKGLKFYLIILTILYNSCEKKISPDVLAVVGSTQVTSHEFIKSYSNKLIQSKIQDSNFERSRVLNELIRTKLFAEGARKNNLNIDSIGRSMVQFEEDIALREQLYKKVIQSIMIEIPDSVIRIHYKWKHTEVYLSHLFHHDKAILDTIIPYLKKDTSQFKNYSQILFKDERLKESGGNLGWIHYNDLDPNLEQIAFSMPFDEPMGPFRSSYGWHILFKKDIREQILLDENHYQNNKKRLKQAILKKKKQIKANDYINDLMANNVVINDSITFRILEKINNIVFDKNRLELKKDIESSRNITTKILELKLNINTILATFPGGNFTVDDLLNNLRSSKPELFLKNPVQQFYKSLRDKMLTEEARSRELQQHQTVQYKIQSKKDEYLAREYLLYRSKNKRTAHLSKEEVQTLIKELKSEISIKVYEENLNSLFKTL